MLKMEKIAIELLRLSVNDVCIEVVECREIGEYFEEEMLRKFSLKNEINRSV